MEKRSLNSIISASISLIIFVGSPLLLQHYIPSHFVSLFAKTGLNIQSVINQLMIVGFITAAITLTKGFISETSVFFLIISIAQKMFTIIFTIILLGAGNLTNLGITSLNVEIENSIHFITLNYQLFLYITFLMVILKILQTYLEWSKIKKENN